MNILIIDPCEIIVSGLKSVLNETDTNLIYSWKFEDVCNLMNQNNIDLIFLEFELNGTIDFRTYDFFKKNYPNLAIIVFSSLENKLIFQQEQTKNSFFLSKTSSIIEVQNFVKTILMN